VAGVGLSGLGVAGLGVVPNVWLVAAIAFLTYGLDAYGSVLWNPLLQQQVPSALIGRVASVDYFFGFALSPLGLVAAGAAAQTIGVRTTLVIGGAITGLTTLVPLIPKCATQTDRTAPLDMRAAASLRLGTRSGVGGQELGRPVGVSDVAVLDVVDGLVEAATWLS